MNVKDSIYHAVSNYPGGAPALATRMKLAAPTVYAMANPNDDTHEFNLRRFRELLAFTNDMGPLEALCAENGGVFVRTANLGKLGDGELFETATRLGKEFGDVMRVLVESMKDQRITPREMAEFKQQTLELQQVSAELLMRFETKAKHGPGLKVA